MNYDTIIVELLSRVQALEEQVAVLNERMSNESVTKEVTMEESKKITTADIKEYIDSLKLKARAEEKNYIVLIARDISNELNLKKRYPMVCNAMRQSMHNQDEVINSPASGYSSTLEIKYFL